MPALPPPQAEPNTARPTADALLAELARFADQLATGLALTGLERARLVPLPHLGCTAWHLVEATTASGRTTTFSRDAARARARDLLDNGDAEGALGQIAGLALAFADDDADFARLTVELGDAAAPMTGDEATRDPNPARPLVLHGIADLATGQLFPLQLALPAPATAHARLGLRADPASGLAALLRNRSVDRDWQALLLSLPVRSIARADDSLLLDLSH